MFLGNFKDDDFLHESFEPFIKTRKTTNVLNALVPDDSARAIICENFINVFASKGRKAVVTGFHLDWAMEVIGYSFSLPPKKYWPTIQASLTIYSDWLNFPEYAPTEIKTLRPKYLQEMISHLSLTFYPQKDSSKQVEICKEVLNIYEKISQDPNFPEETWDLFLKISLEVTKSVISNVKLVDGLGKAVVLFVVQLFIKTCSRNVEIWKEFKEFIWGYADFEFVSLAWTACVEGLTQALIRYLVGSKKSLKIRFFSKINIVEQIIIAKDPESVIYLWTRFLNVFLVKEKEFLVNRVNFLKGVCSCIEFFLKKAESFHLALPVQVPNDLIYSSSQPLSTLFENNYKIFVRYLNKEFRLPSFSIVSLINVFGQLLFSVTSDKKFSVIEKSLALRTLCKIFEKAEGPFPSSYSEKFLSCIMEAVSSKSPDILTVICEEFYKLPAIHSDFLKFSLKTDLIVQVSSYFLMGNQNNINTKRTCLRLLSVFASLASFFNISGLTQQISDSLLVVLLQDHDENTYHLMIWTVMNFLNRFQGDSESLNSYVKTFAENLNIIDQDQKKGLYLLEALSILPFWVDFKMVTTDVAKFVIRKLISVAPKRGRTYEEIVFRCFQCAVDFILQFPEVMLDSTLAAEVFKTIENKRIDEKFKDYQHFFTQNIMKNAGRRESSRLLDLFKDFRQCPEYFDSFSHCFVLETEKTTKICINDSSGQHIWRLSEVGYDEKRQKNLKLHPDPQKIIKTLKISGKTEPLELNDFSEYEISHEKIIEKFLSQQKTLELFEAEKISLPTKKSFIGAVHEIKESWVLKNYRRFIGMLGCLDLDSTDNLQKVKLSFKTFLETYDNFSSTSTFLTSVLYLPTPESTSETMNPVQSYSEAFSSYLKSSGDLLSDSVFFPVSCKGLIEKYSKVVYKDFKIFQGVISSPSFLTSHQLPSLVDFVKDSDCVLLWNQRLNDPESKKVPILVNVLKDLNKNVLVVTPLSKNVVRVNVFFLGGLSRPLLDGMVVAVEQLSVMVQFTVFLYHETFSHRFELWKAKSRFLAETVFLSSEQRIKTDELICLFDSRFSE